MTRTPVGPLSGIALGLVGVAVGASAWVSPSGTALVVPTVLPGVQAGYAPDRLGGVFLVLIGAVAVVASLWALGGATGAAATPTAWTAFLAFVAGLLGVCAAADVIAFLAAWEVMAVASTVLVLTEFRRGATVTGAGLWYAAMTQLSFLCVLAGFAVLARDTGSLAFADLAEADPAATSTSVAVVLLVVGFAAKAGAVPLHVWLPRAHPEAPSHVSAVMSAAMVKAGIYGVLLVLVRLVPGGPQWWGVLVLALGAGSAVFGILQASVAVDLKRLLAYSTTENVGLILLAIGAAQVFAAHREPGTARVALVAALLLTVAHAAAKTPLFLTAGSILHATGERNLDALGGLWRAMPWTATSFGLAALGAAALPISAGFAAEWALLQALIHAGPSTDAFVAVTTAVTVTVVALTAGLALLTFTKAFGIAFLGRPRAAGALAAHEVGRTERAGALVGAGLVVLLGLVPGPLAAALGAAIPAGEAGWFGSPQASAASVVAGGGTTASAGLVLIGLGTPADAVARGAQVYQPPADYLPAAGPAAGVPVLDPIALTLLGLALLAVGLVATRRLRRRIPRRRVDLMWGCGGVRTSPRMQYTATSYAEPLTRVFDGVLGLSRSVEATAAESTPYLEQEVLFAQRTVDVVENRVYAPLTRAATWAGDLARRVQNGSINRYLMFSFAAVLLVLAVVSR